MMGYLNYVAEHCSSESHGDGAIFSSGPMHEVSSSAVRWRQYLLHFTRVDKADDRYAFRMGREEYQPDKSRSKY